MQIKVTDNGSDPYGNLKQIRPPIMSHQKSQKVESTVVRENLVSPGDIRKGSYNQNFEYGAVISNKNEVRSQQPLELNNQHVSAGKESANQVVKSMQDMQMVSNTTSFANMPETAPNEVKDTEDNGNATNALNSGMRDESEDTVPDSLVGALVPTKVEITRP